MLEEGYVERRVGASLYPRLLRALLATHYDTEAEAAARGAADEASRSPPPPSFLLRLLMEASWRHVHKARVRAGERSGAAATPLAYDAAQRLSLLGPRSVAAMKTDLSRMQ